MKKRLIKIVVLVMFVFLVNGRSITCQAASNVKVSTFDDLRKYLGETKDYIITIASNIEITGKLTVTGNKSIVGNGKCLYRGTSYTSNYLIVINEGAYLNIISNLYLSGNSDKIKIPTKPLIHVGKGSVLKLGEQVNLYKNYSNNSGGAICCEGTMYIQGANIYNCQCNTSGGAIQLREGTKCYMSAGRIYSNKASDNGGSIAQNKDSTFEISGGLIDSNTCLMKGNGILIRGTLILKGEGQISKNNDVYIDTSGLVQTGNWSKPHTIALTSYPQVGKKLVSNGKKYKSYFIWSQKQEMTIARPICIVGDNLVVGAYYPINYYTDSAKKKLYATQNKLYGSALVLLDKGPVLTGYTFKGWFTKPTEGTNMTGATYLNNVALNVYSQYSANRYEVSYQSQNIVIRKDRVIYNTKYGSQPVITMDNYRFTGWYLDKACTKFVTSDTIVKTAANHTLYAGWKPLSCQVSFDATGGEVNLKKKEVIYNDKYGTLPKPYQTGYEFIGWYTLEKDGNLCDENTIVTKSSNHTLYARWKPNVYMVTWDSLGGTASFTFSNVTYGTSYHTIPSVTKVGYHLDGWYTERQGGKKCDESTIVKTAANHILYARWIKDKEIVKNTIFIKKIYITGMMNYYKEKQSINTSGAKLVIEYSNNTKKTLYSGWTIDGYKKTSGQRYVVFRYGGKSCKVKCTWLTTNDIAKIKPTKQKYSGYIGDKSSINFSSYKEQLVLTYKSSNSRIVKVSKTGKLEFKKSGTVNIIVTIRLGSISKKYNIKIVVKKPTLVSGHSYGEKWNQLQFRAYLKGSKKKPVYLSSNSKVAKIDIKTGKLSAIKTGKVTITIKVGSYQKKYRVIINKSARFIIVE